MLNNSHYKRHHYLIYKPEECGSRFSIKEEVVGFNYMPFINLSFHSTSNFLSLRQKQTLKFSK